MAGVGDELPHPGLALLPDHQRGTNVPQHPVERRTDLPDLGTGIGLGVRDAFEERHLTAVQGEFGDPGGGGGDPAQQAQGDADEDGAREGGGDEPGGGDADLDDDQGGERAAHLGGGDPDEDGAALGGGGGLDAVAAEAGQLDAPGVGAYRRGRRLQRLLLGLRQRLRALLGAQPAVLDHLRRGDVPAVVDEGSERAERLPAPADEAERTGVPQGLGQRPGAGRPLRAYGDGAELVVELAVHVAVEGDGGDGADDGRDDGDQGHGGHDEPGPQGPRPPQPFHSHAPTHPPTHRTIHRATHTAIHLA
ncbi:hypothetical protein SCYAM73S_04541 [Streptomyces cyaneofuscatus]